MGRGSRGGKRAKSNNNGWEKSIPDTKDFMLIDSFPELTGTPKQIKWAKDLREKIGEELLLHAVRGSLTSLEDAQKGRAHIVEKIKKSTKETLELIPGRDEGKTRNEYIKHYQDYAERIKRLNEIFNKKDAKFWINNRTNQLENFRNEKLKKYIDGD